MHMWWKRVIPKMSNHSFKYIQHQDFWWEASKPQICTKFQPLPRPTHRFFVFQLQEYLQIHLWLELFHIFLNHDIHILFNLQIQQTGVFMVN